MTDTLTATIAGLAEAPEALDAALRAFDPDLFGDDVIVAHMEASPYAVAYAQALLRAPMRRALAAALEALTNRGGEKEGEQVGYPMFRTRYHDDRGETWMSWGPWQQKYRGLPGEERRAGWDYEESTFYPLYASPPTSKAEPVRVRELRQALLIDLNVTDEELLRIRNSAQRDGDVKIWGKMLGKIVDAVRAARFALRQPYEGTTK